MSEPDAASTTVRRRGRAKTALTFVGLALLVGLIAWQGPAALWQRLVAVDPAHLALAAVAIVAGTLLGAFNSFVICAVSGVMRPGEFLRAFWCAWAVGLVVPGQVGDLLTLNHTLRRRGLPLSQTIARTALDKAISLVCSLAVATQLFRLGDSPVLHSLSIGAALALAGALAAGVVALAGGRLLERLAITNRWFVGALATAAEVRRTILARPAAVASNVLVSIAKVAATGVSYWLVLAGLGDATASFAAITIAAVSSGLVAYLPLSANGVGTVEIAATGLFGAIGVGATTVLSMYVLLRLLNLLLAWVPAAFFLPALLRERAR